MKFRWNRFGTLLIVLLAMSASGCRAVEGIERGDLDDWFMSRLLWFPVASAALGAVAAKLLCRLPIMAPRLDCNGAARARFLTWLLVFSLFVVPAFLWADAWFTQPFGEDTVLDALTVLSVSVLHWRVLGLMALVALAFYASVLFFTRVVFGRTCNCKHAFLPKLR